MANRTRGALRAQTADDVVRVLLRRIDQLERRVQRLEAASGQTLPGDYRFDTADAGASVVIRRVSTGTTAHVVGPM